jgi:hypothetical protein
MAASAFEKYDMVDRDPLEMLQRARRQGGAARRRSLGALGGFGLFGRATRTMPPAAESSRRRRGINLPPGVLAECRSSAIAGKRALIAAIFATLKRVQLLNLNPCFSLPSRNCHFPAL